MTDLSNSELRRLDLTLLLVFLGLLRHRKANAVADELGLTQSAISQGLKRLREIFGDPLHSTAEDIQEINVPLRSAQEPTAEPIQKYRRKSSRHNPHPRLQPSLGFLRCDVLND